MSELFSARVKSLEAEELKEAFGDQVKIERKQDTWGDSFITCMLDDNVSMCGGALKLLYVDPTIGCHKDGTVDSKKIRNSRLFGCGHHETWFVQRFGEKFWEACTNFLAGSYDCTRNQFTVWGTGIPSSESHLDHILLRFRADSVSLTPKFLHNLNKTAYFFGETKDARSGDSYYLVVLRLNQAVTRYGNPARGRVCTTAREWAQLDRSAFMRQFEHLNINNGVCVMRGWMIDRQGNEMKPTFQNPVREGSGRTLVSNDGLVEIWTSPQNGDICLSCTMDDDGNVALRYGRPYYPCHGDASITAHQLRRMEHIRRQLIEELTDNAKTWSLPGEIDYSDIRWEDQDTDYGKR